MKFLEFISKPIKGWNHFFHRHADLSIFGPIRICFAILMLINVLCLFPDLEKWFGEEGVLPFEVSKMVLDPDCTSLFQYLPKTNGVLWTCYSILVANLICLLLGIFSRFQLACIFVLFTSFCHRNNIIFDGEDTLFRIMTFYLIFSPCGKYLSVESWLSQKKSKLDSTNEVKPKQFPIWPLRLLQVQTSCVLFFSGMEKLKGAQWIDGTALYYVSRLDDLFYRFPVPEFLFNSFTMIALATWSAVALELTMPILVWFRKTRIFALCVVFMFHLTLDYTMNLNLFQWLMIVGWLSFLQRDPHSDSSAKNNNQLSQT